jgi:hypothetical protein
VAKILTGCSRSFNADASNGGDRYRPQWAVADPTVAAIDDGNPTQPYSYTSLRGVASRRLRQA